MLIRLLQQFQTIMLAPDAQAPDTLPPPIWAKAEGRKATEKVFPKMHLTMYVHVSTQTMVYPSYVSHTTQGGLWVRMTEADDEAT